jgi:hypothetical protein
MCTFHIKCHEVQIVQIIWKTMISSFVYVVKSKFDLKFCNKIDLKSFYYTRFEPLKLYGGKVDLLLNLDTIAFIE